MALPFLVVRCRFSRRIFGAAVLLLAPLVTEICSAAEVTFGGNYSLQLPPGWTAKAGKDNAVIGETNGVNFTANAFRTAWSPEKVMEEAIAVAEKRPGFKLIEKGTVKTSGGRTAQLFRFQVDEGKGVFMGVNYYFRMGKDGVAMVFGLATGVPKSIKNEIEAMVDSVKATAAATQDESWLTAPADKPKESSKAAGAGDSEIAGKYVSSQQSSDYIILKADGNISYQISGESGTGTYTRNGATITLKFGDEDPDDAKLEKDALVDASGKRWVKTTASSAPAAPKTGATRVTFATNCSVEMPAGWTAKTSGKHIEATGPGGMRLDGYSEKSPMSVDRALAVHHSILEKMPGYELVDTDEISTKAGAKGKLSYYRYSGKSGPVAEVGVIIQVAKHQIATLRFLTPSASKKLDATFQDAVEAIFSSLTISE